MQVEHILSKFMVDMELDSKNGSLASFIFSNATLTEKKKKIFESIWNKSEVFYFVNHPGMFDMRFPCVTINDGEDPGKPCIFPFR